MNTEPNPHQPMSESQFIDAVIRLGLVAILLVLCFRIFAPFVGLMLWALILAVTLYPIHQMLAKKLGNRQGGSSTTIVLIGLLMIGTPLAILGDELVGHFSTIQAAVKGDGIELRHPAPKVAEWPVVGKQVFEVWTSAADNLPLFLEEHKAGLEKLARRAFATSASTMSGVLLFLGSLIVAGIMMAYAQSGVAATERIFTRFAGRTKGPRLHVLSTLTIRSVAAGVLGVALIQSLILGIGFVFAGIPAAAILAGIVMLIGIMQLPALLISLPVIAWLWASGDGSNTHNVIWTVYLLIGGFADNFLKPILLGRGVDAPMPIILLGAIGGMISAGIIGLFLGAVLLALGYELFMEWVESELPETDEDSATKT